MTEPVSIRWEQVQVPNSEPLSPAELDRLVQALDRIAEAGVEPALMPWER